MGRPKGSKNKPKDQAVEVVVPPQGQPEVAAKRRGRPPGIKNKPKADSDTPAPAPVAQPNPTPGRRGRPPGSKNTPRVNPAADVVPVTSPKVVAAPTPPPEVTREEETPEPADDEEFSSDDTQYDTIRVPRLQPTYYSVEDLQSPEMAEIVNSLKDIASRASPAMQEFLKTERLIPELSLEERMAKIILDFFEIDVKKIIAEKKNEPKAG